MSDRIAIFIDGGYLDKVTEELGFFLDMKKL